MRYLGLIILIFVVGCKDSEISKFKVAVDAQVIDKTIITKDQSKSVYSESKDLPNNTQLSIAIIENGNTKFYGIKRERDSIFTSISKVFTATLLADFVVNEQLELNDRISDYVDTKNGNSETTLLQLANHTSGLPIDPSNLNLDSIYRLNPYKDYDERKLKEYLIGDLNLSGKQGKEFEYSSLGMGILGYILGKVDTTTYENLLQTKIFSKYQMTSSTTNRELIQSKLVKGLNEEGKETNNWDANILVAAGGILSSVSDLSKFAQAQFEHSNEILQLTRKSTFVIDDISEVGLGWFIIRTDYGVEALEHSGGTPGYISYLLVDTKNKNGVIILSNVSALNPSYINIQNLCHRLMKTLKKR